MFIVLCIWILRRIIAFIHSLARIHSLIHSFTRTLARSFARSFVRSSVRSFGRSFVLSFIHSFTHSLTFSEILYYFLIIKMKSICKTSSVHFINKWINKNHSKWFPTTLRKHAYSNILKILPPKTENFQIKILIFFHISDQNIDCGYSLEAVLTSTHNLCFWAEIRKIMYTPVNPSFTI